MLINAIIEIFGLEEEDIFPEDETRKEQYKLLDSHLGQASGRWNGWKIIQTDVEELSKVVYTFKREYTDTISQVKISSSKFLFLLNPEQISTAGNDQKKVAAFDKLIKTHKNFVLQENRTELRQWMENFNSVK